MDRRLVATTVALSALLFVRWASNAAGDAQEVGSPSVASQIYIDRILRGRNAGQPSILPLIAFSSLSTIDQAPDLENVTDLATEEHYITETTNSTSPSSTTSVSSGVVQTANRFRSTQPATTHQKLRRRDPLDLPIIDDDAWFEWILSVKINGSNVSDGTLIVEESTTKRLAISKFQAEQWRLIFDENDLVTLQGDPFLPLDKINGLSASLDKTGLSIELDIPAQNFRGFAVELTKREALPPTASNGLFLDYDLLFSSGQTIRARLDGLLEAGAFSKFGVVTNSVQLGDLTRNADALRLETTLSRDFPSERRSIRFGDSLTVGGELARGIRFAGLQWGANFATDPSFIAFPRPAIGGLASQESVVDVIIGNLTRATEEVPSGPFSINNLPVVTGSGEIQLRVTDLLGRETLITQPYYVSDRLLRSGLHDFSYAFGFERENFGVESFDYDRILATALHRYGVTDQLTLNGYAEATLGTVQGAAGAVFNVGSYGLISAAANLSGDDHAEIGFAGSLAYEYVANTLSFSTRTQFFDDDFRAIARSDNDLRRIDQLNAGFRLRDYGRIGLLYLNRSTKDAEDSRSVSLSYSVPIGDGAVILRAGRTLNPQSETAITASYAVALGPARSLSTEIDHRNSDTRARASYRKSRGASDLGFEYRLAADVGEAPRAYDARLGYTAPIAAGSVDLQRLDGENNMRANLSGSLAVLDGEFRASRRLGRAFGLVSLPGYSDVRVYMDNRLVGNTDSEGSLLVPGLRPYERNRLRFDVSDLPLSARIGSDELEVTPFDRTGVKVEFQVERLSEVTAYFADQSGRPLSIGTALSDQSGGVQVRIGRNGFAHIEGVWQKPLIVTGRHDDQTITCRLGVPPPDEILPDLGDIQCAAI